MKKITTIIGALMLAIAANAQTASVMAIHNSADPALDTVDMYLLDNGTATMLKKDFAFRTSTGFISAPAERPIRIVFAGKNSTSIADSVIGFGYNLPNNGKFILIAQGHFQNGFTPQKPFTLNVASNVEDASSGTGNKIAVYHGSTDAPAVDIKAFQKSDFSTLLALAENASYGAITSYASVDNEDYLINVSLPGSEEALFTYSAPLKTLGKNGEPVFAFASGFLNPSSNLNGKGFGIFVAFRNGDVVELPLQASAKLQIIHNSPDALASTVDIYSDVSGSIQLLIDNLSFRKATPYLSVPSNTSFNVWIAPGNSTSYTQSVYNTEFNLYGGIDAVVIASGVLDTSKHENGSNSSFDLIGMAGSSASTESGKVSLSIVHGSTDAPAVDVRAGGATGALLAENLSFFDNTSIINAAPNDISVSILAAGTSTIVATYSAPLSSFNDSSLVIMASGFLSPNVPSGKDAGAAFGLFAVTASGRVIQLPSVNTSLESISGNEFTVYPNPTKDQIFVNAVESIDYLRILSLDGKILLETNKDDIEIENLPNGVYILEIGTAGSIWHTRVIKN